MALDFPDSPTTGQTYTGPSGEIWVWDGVKWAVSGSSSSFPSGTVLSFFQAAAPVGWTQVTTHNDKLLRVVSSTGGGSGGSNSFSSVNAQTVVGNHTLAASELPTVNSSASASITVYPNGNNGYYLPMTPGVGWGYAATTNTGATYVPTASNLNPSITYTNSFSAANTVNSSSTNTGGGAHNHPITMSIQYCDLILASKN